MKNNLIKSLLLIVVVVLTLLGVADRVSLLRAASNAAQVVTTAFTYQGQLQYAGGTANGDFDLAFSLYDSPTGGTLVATPITQTLTITDGIFSTVLDFGVGVFAGDARYLELSARPTGLGAFTTLSPRQELTAVPYAVFASNVDWSGIANIPADLADGDNQNLFETITGDTGSTTADTDTDTLTIVGSGSVTTAVTGDTVTITGTNQNLFETVTGDTGSTTADTITDTLNIVGDGTVNTVVSGDTITITGSSVAGSIGRPVFSNSTLDDSAARVGEAASLTIGVDGLGLISYADPTNGSLKVAHCNDIGCTSSTNSTIDATFVPTSTSITIDNSGRGLISYCDASGVKVARCNDTTCSSATTRSVESGNCSSTSIVLARHDSSGTVDDEYGFGLISYNIGTTLKAASCDNAACTAVTVQPTIDGSGGEYNSLTIGADNNPLISYRGVSPTGLKVARCNNTTCSSVGSINTLVITDVTHTSMIVGSDGLGLISYRSAAGGELRVAHCDDNACSSATLTALDGVGPATADMGRYSSITIGSDGFGVIAYQQFGNRENVKVAHCNDLTCSSADTKLVIGSSREGHYNAITIGVDGMPLIVHHNDQDGELRAVHCSNVFCVPFFRRR